MKRIIFAVTALGALTTFAEIPAGYYDALEGKSGEALLAAVKEAAHPADYNRITYQTKTWDAFEKTDTRVIDGVTVWWDMYSNVLVAATAHDGLNIEHSVANSWFGGKTSADPYADLFHLNPSNSEANQQKGDLPLGVVKTIAWENGLVKTGTPKTGTAGGAGKVFEPADEYKGDFARAYFYIFTAYDVAPWKTDQSMYSFTDHAVLEPWAIELLRTWAAEDPVDSKEVKRNEEIYKLQNNRNPYIDHPELIEYIWGDKKSEPFALGEAAAAIDRPQEPVFTSRWATGVNTYAGRWWDNETVAISHESGNLWVSIDGGEYQQYGPGVDIPAAPAHGHSMQLAAYTEAEVGDYTLRSSIARLTLVGKDPGAEDFTEAGWKLVTSDDDFTSATDHFFILRSASNGNVMGHEGGTTATKFMPDAGRVRETEEMVYQLPINAAILRFRNSGTDKYVIEVIDPLHNKTKGFWNVNGSNNQNTLNATTGTSATVGINPDGSAVITFDGGRTLQYNKTQPRFTNYATKQGAVSLSRYAELPDDIPSGIDEETIGDEGFIAVDGNTIIVPEGWRLYSLNGRASNGRNLDAGIYIAHSPKGKAVKIMIR